ncbi:HhH-GPD superfamily base excision DNA repair protein [Poriferisphaera corsica]|uniref:DNA-(apurinic or apyrimidinic site) lyase n=2 Tax=Poriferisphaera corsica TaxID=2528020 RepID=A0A517YQ67_9BACT|nr:HhH-GPD superfamily base excision DNA repair protein [Poriferisphaera corsica]
MNNLLVQKIGRGDFPSPKQLAAVTESELKHLCKVGYRAKRIIKLARCIVNGSLNLSELDSPTLTTDQLYPKLLAIHGIGPYAASNLCQLLAHYDRIPIDSETHRHFCKHHNLKRPTTHKSINRLDKKIRKHYTPYAPYQFLAYWFDLWQDYEDHLDKPAHDWQPHELDAFTASNLN